MKWFKHQSQSHTDEKLADLLSDCGLEGYGFWWLLMEVVATQCVDDKCCATYSLPHWSRLLYSHHNKVGKYLGKLEVIGIVTVESTEGKLRVTIPNLLKYRDEYSKKSRQTPGSVRPKKEKEKEKEKENKEEDIKTTTPELPVMASKQKALMMGINDFRFLYSASFGESMPGGCNNQASELCRQFTTEKIREAFEIASMQKIMTLAYVVGVLNGNGKQKAASTKLPVTFEQQKMDNTKQAMEEFAGGFENDGYGQKAICLDDGRSISSLPV